MYSQIGLYLCEVETMKVSQTITASPNTHRRNDARLSQIEQDIADSIVESVTSEDIPRTFQMPRWVKILSVLPPAIAQVLLPGLLTGCGNTTGHISKNSSKFNPPAKVGTEHPDSSDQTNESKEREQAKEMAKEPKSSEIDKKIEKKEKSLFGDFEANAKKHEEEREQHHKDAVAAKQRRLDAELLKKCHGDPTLFTLTKATEKTGSSLLLSFLIYLREATLKKETISSFLETTRFCFKQEKVTLKNGQLSKSDAKRHKLTPEEHAAVNKTLKQAHTLEKSQLAKKENNNDF